MLSTHYEKISPAPPPRCDFRLELWLSIRKANQYAGFHHATGADSTAC